MHNATGAVGSGDGVFFADLNGDLMADYIYVYKDGKVVWWRNDGPSSDVKVGWKWHGPIILRIGTSNATHDNVLFADINGDGRRSRLLFFLKVSPINCTRTSRNNVGIYSADHQSIKS